MELRHPFDSYVKFWEALSGTRKERLPEIDYIVTKKETLIYNFFDWPLRATTARLVVVGISNTIHLPETLQPKLQSRIGGNRCHFIAYNVQDTMTILKTRLGMLGDSPGYPVFEEDAIKVGGLLHNTTSNCFLPDYFST
jgi:origin recognition complex subunit 1